MSDRVTYCDVCECAECPKYGDDCDGDKRNDDLISRKDAIKAVKDAYVMDAIYEVISEDIIKALSALPSAEAVKVAYICDGRKCDSDCSECFRTTDIEHAKDFELVGDTYFQQPSAESKPTIIRSKALMPAKDFKEWVKRIRETNPNAVVIPCDAEVVSAEDVSFEDAMQIRNTILFKEYTRGRRDAEAVHGVGRYENAMQKLREMPRYLNGVKAKQIKEIPSEAVQRWIPCEERLPSESGWYVISVVGFENITDVSYFYSDESKWSDVSHTQSVVAWMPLPEPYKGGDDE